MAYTQMGDQALALEYLRRALARVKGNPDREFSLHELIGDVHLRRGDAEAARDAYERAVAIFEGARALMGDESRVGYQANATQVYTCLVLLYAGEMHDPARALHWTERAKSRAFTELLGLTHIPVPEAPAQYHDLIAREHVLLQTVRELRSRLTAADEHAPAAVGVRVELLDATRKLGAIWAELGDALPDYAALRTGAVARLALDPATAGTRVDLRQPRDGRPSTTKRGWRLYVAVALRGGCCVMP
jgi:tetratricopeptide (TPR) repeat protein